MKKSSLILSGLLLASTLGAKEFVSIGTGGMTGTYYPIGGAICRLVNKDPNIKCSVQSTGGSVYNVNNVLKKELTFGFVQSDVVYDKFNGTGKFEKMGDQRLRSVVSIYPELLALVVTKDSGIKSIEDLAGKKYNVGNPGSGNEVTTLAVFKAKKFDVAKLGYRGVLTVQECPHALKDKKIDGYSFMVGHPTANITDAANSMPIDILDITGEDVDKMIADYPYFAKGVIPNGSYEGINRDVNSIGVKAVLVADESASNEAVRAVVKSILDNFDEYKTLHPALKSVTKESLIQGLSAPLHPAAEAVFKEAGIIK
ncbi:TAXI family TRAP transporter solute-binding subunit [Campylobacter sp. RM9344]|uniref:TAXI family TRAP transporter solute-binding subunit n=1 Tax=Campylobacter californiensis TaxID=1032243 RepID=A0AAW3ZV53_9BACT|nr:MULTISPECIES: TAXI family TRAP transporter solute-binding subunit [unclassified Campylobacter]MBE2983853.1 TAXI family TRAP transporter solute-binding subunit [Campylobacter sp. RM6883]MBE2994391.1 TAXI family TRAP transporter solute-binding subunit [Campylobacter sp. RM6913]MBE3028699.1 TAXI family TRAP transporter solute-binding subunit [Campylobacter sp. RM9344]MBE3605393.1 TAXI family TRAP transporter solute-binding subunit [Campylobacter sp. RM13119]MBE3607588.1 TAXI family TRAP transp